MKTKQIVVKQMPVDLWRQLKVQAARENITLQRTVAKAIEQYIAQSAA